MKINQSGIINPVLNTINSILSLTQSKINSPILNDVLKNCFKVLILDDVSLKILSPLLKQSSLSKNNICLTLNMSEKKQKITNTMAIYLVSPSKDNLAKIIEEIKENLYENYSLNFIDLLQEDYLQDFLTKIIQTGEIKKIYNLNFFPINFKVFHPNIYDFNFNNPFKILNQKISIEKENEEYVQKTSNGLFSIFYNMRIIPKIIFPKNDFIEEIVLKTKNEFESTFKKFPEIKNEYELNPNSNKAVLIILNREADLPIMFHHSSSLGGIIADLCDLKFNSNNKETDSMFLIDPIYDYIWNKNVTEAFYEIGEQTRADYQKYYDEMNQFNVTINTKNTKENNENVDQLAKDSEKLSSTLEHLNEKKIKGDALGKHAKIFGFISDNLNKRNLGELFLIEDMLLRKRKNNNEIITKINEFLQEGKLNSNNAFDFFRLNLIYYFICQEITTDDVKKNMGKYYDKKKMDNILNFFEFKKKKIFTDKKESPSGSFAKKLMTKTFMYVVNSFNTLMTIEQPSIMADIVNNIMNGKNDLKSFSVYNLFDSLFPDLNQRFDLYDCSNVFVYIIGGGSFNEFEHIHTLLNKSNFNVIYGCDKLYKPDEFANEIGDMIFE